jgi:RIO kinase 1
LTAGRFSDSLPYPLDDPLQDPFDDPDESSLSGQFADLGEPRERPARHRSGRGGHRSLAELEDSSPTQEAEAQHREFLRQLAHGREVFQVEPDRPEDDPDATWSTYYTAQQGPEPVPEWVITERAAVDHALGVLKTGKEADVHLVNRSLPGTERSVVLAAKRYRDTEHSQFTRDAAYLAGRRVRKSRDQRAMDHKTRTGRELLAGQWAGAEFGYLKRLWELGAPVPYPVQLLGSELMMELITAPDGSPAPRLVQTDLTTTELIPLWEQLRESMLVMAENGWTHGDLSEYNVLVAGDRLVLIDLPQVIDVVSNPDGRLFLARDAANVSRWFTKRGVREADESALIEELLRTAGLV